MKCERKLSFSTIEQAERTAAAVATVNGVEHAPIRIYECHRCGHLHFTSKPRRDGDPTDTTVHVVGAIVPLFEGQEAKEKTGLCGRCGRADARFPLRGQLYHRRCRNDAIAALPREERRAALMETATESELRAIQANLARTGGST